MTGVMFDTIEFLQDLVDEETRKRQHELRLLPRMGRSDR